MNAMKLSQDCLLPEQLVAGQSIPQDFLGILLDKLSGEDKTFLVNQEDLEGKKQEQETKQNDEPSGGIDDKKDLLSLLQAWFLWDRLNTCQPPEQNGADEKVEDAGVHPVAAGPLEIVEDGINAGTGSMMPFFDRTDDIAAAEDHITVKDDARARDDITAKEDLQNTLPNAIDWSVLMLQPVPADKNQFQSARDNVIANEKDGTADLGEIPIKPFFNKQKEDHPLKAFTPVEAITAAAAAEDEPLPVSEDGRETEINGDYRVLFQKRDIEVPNPKIRPVKAPIPDEPFLTTRNTPEDDGKTSLPTTKRPAPTVAHGGALEKVEAIPGDDWESKMLKDDSSLFQRGDHLKAEVLHGKDGVKIYDKTAFGSVITDRVERVVEQYANKNSSSDMVVRLKIDGKETILVGLKDEGRTISVQIKTGSEGVMNFIQSQKDAITRSLEGKNIYATITVDINDQRGFERNNRDGGRKENSRDEEDEEFSAYLNAMA